MKSLKACIQTYFHFVLSLGIHALLFAAVLFINTKKKSNETPTHIEFAEVQFGEFESPLLKAFNSKNKQVNQSNTFTNISTTTTNNNNSNNNPTNPTRPNNLSNVNDADKMDNLSRLSNISNPNNSADPLDPRNLNNFDNANQSEGFSDLSTTVSPHQSYLDKVRSKIQFHKIYPKASLALKERGTVKLKVRLEKSGYVQKIEIIESSDFKRLDEAAIKAVVDASPFGEFPPEVKFATWSIIVPMRFEFSN